MKLSSSAASPFVSRRRRFAGRYRTSVPGGRTTSQVPPCVSKFWHLISPAFSWA